MKLKMKAVGVLLVAAAGVVIFAFLKGQADRGFIAHPIRGHEMLFREVNPVPLPVRLQVFSTLKKGDAELSAKRPRGKKRLRHETTNEMAIRSLVDAMRKTVWNPTPRSSSRSTDVVTYHIYFEMADASLPLYYRFFYKAGTNEPSLISVYSTAGNLWNAEGLEHWFTTNNLLPELN